jgi:hypothetical protein
MTSNTTSLFPLTFERKEERLKRKGNPLSSFLFSLSPSLLELLLHPTPISANLSVEACYV